MSRLRYLLAVFVAVTVAAVGAGTTTAHAADDVGASGLPKCNDVLHHNPSSNIHLWIPVYMDKAHSIPYFDCTMSRGDRGIQVLVLQQALNACYTFPNEVTGDKYSKGKILEDAMYGPQTYRAVWYAQGTGGITDPDGVYGPQTWEHMWWPQWRGPYGGPYHFDDCVRAGMG